MGRLERKKQCVYQFQLQEKEDSSKSGLNNKENALCHISRIFYRGTVVWGWFRISLFCHSQYICYLSSFTR